MGTMIGLKKQTNILTPFNIKGG
ncbi:uncharacterized protein METZ01_LOCUS458387 [marine metagenome]|uniref:Uncharacterized protein n=1 Tax=marine metagenome TaxID=408172 RepID=A0A383AD67_9ZZZZ